MKLSLLSILPLLSFIIPSVTAKLKDDPRINALGNCAKSCLTKTLSTAATVCGPSDYDSSCLCSYTSTNTNPDIQPHISSLKHCTDACSIGQRESFYKLFEKDKNCRELLSYLKGPRGDGKQKVLKKGEEGKVDGDGGSDSEGKVKDDEEKEKKEEEGGKTAEEIEKEERKKKQDRITFYSFLTAVGVIVFSVIVGMKL